MIPIVAFLQNPSAVDSKLDLEQYVTDQEYHRRALVVSMSGKRLHSAFGATMFRHIHWDNASTSFTVYADLEHMCRVIDTHRPQLILTFGRIPTEAMRALRQKSGAVEQIEFMACHHPNARFKTQYDLGKFAAKVIEHVESMKEITA